MVLVVFLLSHYVWPKLVVAPHFLSFQTNFFRRLRSANLVDCPNECGVQTVVFPREQFVCSCRLGVGRCFSGDRKTQNKMRNYYFCCLKEGELIKVFDEIDR